MLLQTKVYDDDKTWTFYLESLGDLCKVAHSVATYFLVLCGLAPKSTKLRQLV